MAERAVDPIGRRKYQIIAHATEALDGQSNMLAWLERPSTSFGAGRRSTFLIKRIQMSCNGSMTSSPPSITACTSDALRADL